MRQAGACNSLLRRIFLNYAGIDYMSVLLAPFFKFA